MKMRQRHKQFRIGEYAIGYIHAVKDIANGVKNL